MVMQMNVVRGALGGHDESWSTLATVWANVQDMNGHEIFKAKAMGSQATKMITVRYRPDVRPAMHVVLPREGFSLSQVVIGENPLSAENGVILRIEWIQRVSRKEYIVLYCLALDD